MVMVKNSTQQLIHFFVAEDMENKVGKFCHDPQSIGQLQANEMSNNSSSHFLSFSSILENLHFFGTAKLTTNST